MSLDYMPSDRRVIWIGKLGFPSQGERLNPGLALAAALGKGKSGRQANPPHFQGMKL